MSESFTILGDQPVALLTGGVLLAIFQTAKFTELDVADPLTLRVVSLLPGAKAKDFTGRGTYRASLVAFVAVSLCLYYVVCQIISPQTLEGAIRQMAGIKPPDLKGIPYPLYVAALFMGLTQPVIPGLAKAGNALRNFFHDRIEVPKRVVDLSAQLANAIDVRSGGDRLTASTKKNLVSEVRKLISDEWLQQLQSCGDLAFYRDQLQRIKLGDPTTAAQTLRASSIKELRDFIDQLVLFNLIAVMRKSGPRNLGQIATWAQTHLKIQPSNLGLFLTSLALSGLMFSFSLALIWLLFAILGPAITTRLNYGEFSLWPDTDWLGVELWRIVPAIFFAMLVSVSMLLHRSSEGPAGPPNHEAGTLQRVVVFTQSIAPILLACFGVSLAIHFIAEAYQYGVSTKFADMVSFQKIAIIFIRTAPSIALSYCVLLYLSPQWQKQRLSFWWMLLVVVVATAVLAFFVALMFLHLDFLPGLTKLAQDEDRVDRDYWVQFLHVNPAGWDYVIFYVAANVLVAACAFAVTMLFFRAQTPIEALSTRLRGQREMHRAAEAPHARPAMGLMTGVRDAARRLRPQRSAGGTGA